MGLVRKAQKTGQASSPEVAKAATSMSKSDVKDFASTKHKGLPEKKKIAEGKRDGKGAKSKGYSLRDWFKGGGWVQTGGKYDGKPCAKQPGQKTKPYCRDADDRASMSKDERNKRAAKKRKEDPNPDRKGKAKMVTQNNSFEPEANVVEEEKKKKKDACYHKVKSRYSVWPSAYASGALVKCRKVGAANWGNKSEEVETTGLGEGKIADRLRQMNKDAKKRWDTEGEKAKEDAYKALDKVKSNQARMEKGLKEGTQFSNWRDDFKATEYEFIDIIKPEPLVAEASFEIGHTSADVRKAEKSEKFVSWHNKDLQREKDVLLNVKQELLYLHLKRKMPIWIR